MSIKRKRDRINADDYEDINWLFENNDDEDDDDNDDLEDNEIELFSF